MNQTPTVAVTLAVKVRVQSSLWSNSGLGIWTGMLLCTPSVCYHGDISSKFAAL